MPQHPNRLRTTTRLMNDSLLQGLIDTSIRVSRARFYVALENPDSSSGFHPRSNKRSEAVREAEAHFRRYPVWAVARVYNRDTTALVKIIHREHV
jgi:hypothetical protein